MRMRSALTRVLPSFWRKQHGATRKIAVVGGGWAGCAAAVELAAGGHAVTLLEAARALGGRARRVELNGVQLDNGQHILLGAYSESLRLMRTVGVDVSHALLRLPLQMRYPEHADAMSFIVPRLPAPWHMAFGLLRASGLARDDKLALVRFITAARWMDWQLNTDCTVEELLDRFDQSDRMIRLLWRPLCLAALNTPTERASSQVFLNVLRDSLGARRAASDMMIPRTDLTELFPQHAAAFIEQHAGEVRCGSIVRRIGRYGAQWKIATSGDAAMRDDDCFDALVLATPPAKATQLLESVEGAARPPAFDYEPITTCYLQYPPEFHLNQAFFALADDADNGLWGQFVFDRGWLDIRHAGLLSVVVSASSKAIELGHEALASAVAAQLSSAFRQPALASPQWTKVISEKRATFSCTPALRRPANSTGCAGLVIAGDYTAGDYPATLESAVRSGVQAARLLMSSI